MSQFARAILLLGQSRFNRLVNSRVAVCGLGGVGSHAAEALARAGIGRLTLIDFDTVHVSNCNRQLIALHSTLGRPKADAAAERIADINPQCRIEAHRRFINAESLDELLNEPPDILIDAIDSVTPKRDLILRAHQKGARVVSSMGAANRTDPTAVRVADIAETRICPLARALRKRLHRRGLYTGVRAVYSIETPVKLFHHADPGDPAPAHGRPRSTLGSTSYLPAIFGYTAAAEAIRLLTAT